MTFNASDRTLGLVSIWQVLRKMCWEIELLKAIPEKLRVGTLPIDVLHVQDATLYATINAASTGLALVDWLYHTIREDPVLVSRAKDSLGEFNLKSETSFLAHTRKLNKSINACHQICNANKHFHLRKLDKDFKVLVGDIVMEHPDGSTDISHITHIVQNGNTPDGNTSVLELLVDLAAWWEDVLNKLQIPGRDPFFQRGAP